jgi:type VI secretion system secreted protein Hcp
MADTISLTLTGTVQGAIQGDNTQSTLGRENTIEVLSLTQALRGAFERATGRATGHRYYEPITFVKRIDRSSPKLRKALTTNEVVSGTFKWFRPNPDGSGTTEQFFTITFSDGRVVGAEAQLRDTLDPATANLPPLEEIKLVFNTISWEFTNGGIVHQDTWGGAV